MSHILHPIQPISSTQRNGELLYISTSSYDEHWVSTIHQHSFMEIFFVESGTGYFYALDKEIPLKRGDLIIVNPNISHTEKSSGKELLNYIVLGINNTSLELSDALGFQVFHLAKHTEDVLKLMQIMLKEASYHQSYADEICHHILDALLLKLTRLTKKEFMPLPAQNLPSESVYIKEYIDLYFQENISLSKLASMVHLNKYYMIHLFTSSFGISPIQYLLEKRILKSKELLKLTNMKITHIAQAVGFSSSNYFSQAFKRFTGLTPLAYRHKYLR